MVSKMFMAVIIACIIIRFTIIIVQGEFKINVNNNNNNNNKAKAQGTES